MEMPPTDSSRQATPPCQQHQQHSNNSTGPEHIIPHTPKHDARVETAAEKLRGFPSSGRLDHTESFGEK